MADVLIVTPPFAPFDASPPAGPAVLKGHVQAAGQACRTVDLNIRYIRRFQENARAVSSVIGDHAKNRKLISAARRHFRTVVPLDAVPQERVPCCLDPIFALPHSFEEIDVGIANAEEDGYWEQFLSEELARSVDSAPTIVGISVMGPAQLFVARLIARWVGRHWPATGIVMGGSHVTLKASAIAHDARYGADVDAFLPGHCEGLFAALAVERTPPKAWSREGVLHAGRPFTKGEPLHPNAWLVPVFEEDELLLYPEDRIALPIQFTRGCTYGRCTFCTYPAVEGIQVDHLDRTARRFLEGVSSLPIDRISAKDSLLTITQLETIGRAMRDVLPRCRWSATTKISNQMTRKRLADVCSFGCRTLELGVETIHERLQPIIDKDQPLALVERVIRDALDVGISVVINLIYGLPGEQEDEAIGQLRWFEGWKNQYGDRVVGSHNMLEVNEGAPLAREPWRYGIIRGQCGPWAFSYPWNAPQWRPRFRDELMDAVAWSPEGLKSVS